MAKGYIVDKDTGRQLYFGHTENKQGLIDTGHTVVPSDNVRPSETHVFSNGKWVVDGQLTKEVNNLNAKRKRQNEYPSLQDQLKALFEGGPAMVAMKAKLDQVDLRNPIT